MIPRPFDPERTPIEGTMLLEASAGTGKTYALERMAARLIAGRRGIDEILVVTFTNKAAREMKERIRGLLASRAREQGRDEAERERYRRALGGFDSAAIFTIHGFCRMVLSAWPFEASAPFDQELAPDSGLEAAEARFWLAGLDESSVDSGMLGAALGRGGSAEALIGRLAAAARDSGVPSGAQPRPSREESTGFRTLLRESAGRDSALGRAAGAVFDRDWDDAAVKWVFKAGDGANKTAASLGKIREHMRACRRAEGLLGISEAMFGDPAGCGVKDHFKELLFAARQAGAGGGSEAGGLLGRGLNGLLDVLGPCVDYGRGTAVSLVDRYQKCAFDDFAAEALEERVSRVKDERGLWNFSDLVERVCTAVEADDSPLRMLLRARFKAVLIDEFQDTDPRQWEMFRRVFDTPDHVLVLIGDPKQSIYGFRGTGLQAYGAAKAVVPPEGRYRLDTNYRSRRALVEAVNRMFGPLFAESADGGEPVGFAAVKSGLESNRRLDWDGGGDSSRGDALNGVGSDSGGSRSGGVRGGGSESLLTKGAGRTSGECPITLFRCASEDDSADFITAEIRSLLDGRNGGRWRGDDAGAVKASDMAVLVRTERQEEAIMERFARAGIPGLRLRGESVLDQPLAESVDTVLAFLEAPREPGRARALLLDEFFRVPPDLLEIMEMNGDLDELAEAGMVWRDDFLGGAAAETLESVLAFSSRAAWWAERAGRQDAARFLSVPWAHRVIGRPNGEQLWQDWRQLVELIQEAGAGGSGGAGGARGLRAIREWWGGAGGSGRPGGEGAGRDARRLGIEAPAVRVMTMHAAKGLEFPLVFIHAGFKGATTRRIPGPFRFDSGGRLEVDRLRREGNFDRHRAYAWEENKRLWYVAFTRAAYKVWMPLYSGEGKVTEGEGVVYGGFGTAEGEGAASRGEEPPGGPPEDEGAAAGAGAGSSGLRLPWHEVVGSKEAGAFRRRLNAKLDALARPEADGAASEIGMGAQVPRVTPLIEVRSGNIIRRPPLESPKTPKPIPAELPSRPAGERDPCTGSYSSLIRRAVDYQDDKREEDCAEAEDRDTDAVPAAAPVVELGADPADIILPDDRGARFGSLIHAVMERCDFALAQNENRWMKDAANEQLFSSQAAGFYGHDWYRSRRGDLKKLIRAALCAPLPGIGRLCDTLPENRRSEVEFQMAVPKSGRIPLDQTSIPVDSGFLKGFIDLLLLADNRWWVIDWKSNFPLEDGGDARAWSPDALDRLMSAHRYQLQYEIYLLALCRTLSANRGRPVDWKSEIGGAAYLFLRGMREDAASGIRCVKPPLERIRRLADIMGLQGVV